MEAIDLILCLNAAARHQLGLSGIRAMIYLESQDGYTSMTNLSRQLGITTAAITGLADRLEKQGYAERDRASDRRSVHLQLTELGFEVVAEIIAGKVAA